MVRTSRRSASSRAPRSSSGEHASGACAATTQVIRPFSAPCQAEITSSTPRSVCSASAGEYTKRFSGMPAGSRSLEVWPNTTRSPVAGHRPRVVRDARADLQQRRIAAAQALERAEHREHGVLLGAQHRLHRRREAQRGREAEVLLDAAGHREPEMRVAVDEPGEHRLAAPVHALGARIAAIDLLGRADGDDAVGVHDDRGVVVHGAGGVGRDDGGVADHDRHAHPPARRRACPRPSPHTMPEPSSSGKRQRCRPLLRPRAR